MAQTFIVKGDVVTNPSDNDFGRAVFVRITATGDTTGTLEESDGSTGIGQFYLEDGNGRSISFSFKHDPNWL